MSRPVVRRGLIGTVAALGALAIVAAGWLVAISHVNRAGAAGSFLAAVPALEVKMTPASNGHDLPLDEQVGITVAHGQIVSARLVPDRGTPMLGVLGPGGTSWSLGTGLAPSMPYHFEATFDSPHGRVHRTVTFTTLTPQSTFSAVVTPGDAETVGVGQPITVRFDSPIADAARPAIEQRLQVHTSTPVSGAWHWFSDQEVHYRPQQAWPANSQVDVEAALAGANGGNGSWGERDITSKFAIGDAHVSTVDIAAHTMTVTDNGAVVKVLPMSAGRPKYPTMGGTHVVLSKQQDVLMDSQTNGIPRDSPDGYYEHVFWDVRISNGGEFVHAAPWSVGSQGSDNVSHGCVNLSVDNATWFFGFAKQGDIVNVVNSPRAPDGGDAGTRDWNMSWADWLAGSALPH